MRANSSLAKIGISSILSLRLGTLTEGPYGVAYAWEHVSCAAQRAFPKLEEAYAQRAWEHAKEPPEDLPPLESLAGLREEAQGEQTQRRELPYAELAPSGRSRCKHCTERIQEGSPRVVLAREVQLHRGVEDFPTHVCADADLSRTRVAVAAVEPQR